MIATFLLIHIILLLTHALVFYLGWKTAAFFIRIGIRELEKNGEIITNFKKVEK